MAHQAHNQTHHASESVARQSSIGGGLLNGVLRIIWVGIAHAKPYLLIVLNDRGVTLLNETAERSAV